MGHRVTEEWSAMAAHAGIVAVLYYALSPRGLDPTEDIRQEARNESAFRRWRGAFLHH